eukprot:TRINITY_DN5368_c0_g2_i1.p1 TRINITY_DN5368_c0_g2~~TRINITY_DN5368_c0_g2_i1.p1  ORF type:complete len:357 (-),score=37.97 TRINITY_DN5368_c0_g2_i1:81-1151(-)
MRSRLSIIVASILSLSVFAEDWAGNYTVESNCDTNACCCPTVGSDIITVSQQANTLKFTSTLTGQCKDLKQAEWVATSPDLSSHVASATVTIGGQKSQVFQLESTRLGIYMINQAFPSCSITLAAHPLPEAYNLFWTGDYKVIDSCQPEKCCCPSSSSSITINENQFDFILSGKTVGKCGSVDEYGITFDTEYKSREAPQVSATTFTEELNAKAVKTANGVTIAMMDAPECSFSLIERALVPGAAGGTSRGSGSLGTISGSSSGKSTGSVENGEYFYEEGSEPHKASTPPDTPPTQSPGPPSNTSGNQTSNNSNTSSEVSSTSTQFIKRAVNFIVLPYFSLSSSIQSYCFTFLGGP